MTWNWNTAQLSLFWIFFFLYILCFRVRVSVFMKKLSFIIFLHYFVITTFSNFVYREMKSYIRRIFFWRVSISINLAPWIFQDTSCIFRYSLILHSPLANENLTSISFLVENWMTLNFWHYNNLAQNSGTMLEAAAGTKIPSSKVVLANFHSLP